MINNKNFYPTPPDLIRRMKAKIEGDPHKILEPSNAFKVGKKVIIPIYRSYGQAFVDPILGRWKLNWGVAEQLDDIDTVMNYFDGMEQYTSMRWAIEQAFESGQTSRIVSTYFTITVYKKGTIHLTFNSEDVLRRFNVTAAKGKNWLPDDYGARPYQTLTPEERETVDSFDGEKAYTKNLNKPIFAKQPDLLQLAEYV